MECFGLGVGGTLATETEMTSGHVTEGMLVTFMMTRSLPSQGVLVAEQINFRASVLQMRFP